MTDRFAVAVLAGGEGRRMGGGKPLRSFAGERLIDRALRHARSWTTTVVVAVRHPAQIGPTDARIIRDADAPGPVGGVLAALEFAHTAGFERLLAIPADMPFLPPDLPGRLVEAIGDHACALASSCGQLHPVCGLWRSDVLAEAKAYAGAGRRSLKGLAEAVGFVAVEWPAGPRDPFFNVNSSEDLAEAARRAR